jgi:hypothetical protein
LNELRKFVALFKPLDLHPCVEDPTKLVYLDLEGCFGDVCDLSNCAYLKSKPRVSKIIADEALKSILDEQWGYDDLNEPEEEDEPDSQAFSVQSYSQGLIERSFRSTGNIIQPEQSTSEEDDVSLLSDDDSTVEVEDQSPTNDSQVSESLLWRDSQTANSDLVAHYSEVAMRGDAIFLKSVDALKEEISV